MQSFRSRALLRAALLALAALFIAPLASTSAHAADAYRYWSYWWGAGETWEYAASGPSDRVLSDGDVEGWLFLTSAEAEPSKQPGAAPDFAALCPDGEPVPDMIRVGIVIDYGTPADTPDGDQIPEGQNPQEQCITLPAGSTGAQALAAVSPDARVEQGVTCGITGYPESGCFEIVAVPAEDAPAATSDESDSWPVWPVVAGLVVLSAIVVLLAARKRGQQSS